MRWRAMRITRALNSLGPLHSLLAGRSSHRLTAAGRVTSLLPPHTRVLLTVAAAAAALHPPSFTNSDWWFGKCLTHFLFMWCVYIIIGVCVISGSTLTVFLRTSDHQVLFHISVIFWSPIWAVIISFKNNFYDSSVYQITFGLCFCS